MSLNQKNIPTCLKKSSERNPHNKHMKTQTFLWCRCLLPFFPGRQLPAPTKSSWVITLLNRAMATLNRFTVKTRSLLNNFRPCFSEWSKVLKLIPFSLFCFFKDVCSTKSSHVFPVESEGTGAWSCIFLKNVFLSSSLLTCYNEIIAWVPGEKGRNWCFTLTWLFFHLKEQFTQKLAGTIFNPFSIIFLSMV